MSFIAVPRRPSGCRASVSQPLPIDNETEAVRRIVARLESLPPEKHGSWPHGVRPGQGRQRGHGDHGRRDSGHRERAGRIRLDQSRPSWSRRWPSSRSGPPAGRATIW